MRAPPAQLIGLGVVLFFVGAGLERREPRQEDPGLHALKLGLVFLGMGLTFWGVTRLEAGR